MLYIGFILSVLIGIIHSYLGEKYILIRLFKRENLPKLFGSDLFVKRSLRFSWHLTTVAWWGLGAILLVYASEVENVKNSILLTISVVFIASGALSAGFTRGKHLSWIVFWSIAGICIYTALS